MPQLSVGLDLGSHTLKRIRLQSGFRTIEIVDFTCLALPQDDRPRMERVSETLQQLELVQANDLVATALPGDETSIRLLNLPFQDRKRVLQTIGFELESQIPFPLDQTLYDYLSVGLSAEGGSRQLVALCQSELLGRWLELFKSAGMDPRLIGTDSLAYTSLLELLPKSPEHLSTAVVDIGQQFTSLCIVGPEGVEYARTLSVGGAQCTAALAESFQVDLTSAEQGKLEAAFIETSQHPASTTQQAQISKTLTKSLSDLNRALRQSFATHESMTGRSTSKIWVCGGGANITNLDTYLTTTLGIEVERIKADLVDLPGMERLATDDTQPVLWAKPLGLALHAHQGGRQGWLNLRQGIYAFKGDFQYMKGKLLRMGVGLVILIVLAIGYAITRHISLSSFENKLDNQVSEVIQNILNKKYSDPEKAISIMKDKLAPEADLLPRITALDIFRLVHERLSSEMKVTFKDNRIRPKNVRLTGFTDSFESVEKIKTALEADECFTEIETGKVQRTADGSQVEFPLTIVVGC